MSRVKAVVIGGGTGAPVSIRTLLDMGCDVASIVSMVDDGGSTGILRARGGVIPPGDVRKCIGAMSADYDGIVARAFRHRFDYLDNHSLGNLVLTAMAAETGSFPDAIRVCERLLDARGHVYPSTLSDVTLSGMTTQGEMLEGQACIGDAPAAMRYVALTPADPPAYPAALNAIREANLIVLGPGSLFTSIIPNLLVPGVIEAIQDARAREDDRAYTVFVCSLADMQGETWGLSAREHYEALEKHGLAGLIDFMLVHRANPCGATRDAHSTDSAGAGSAYFGSASSDAHGENLVSSGSDIYHDNKRIRQVAVCADDVAAIEARGTRVLLRDLVDEERPTWHDPSKLQEAFVEVLDLCRSRQM